MESEWNAFRGAVNPEHLGPSREQMSQAREAAEKRTVDPLKDWVRPRRNECPICMLPFPMDREGEEPSILLCCGNKICDGCKYDRIRVKVHSRDRRQETCPLCRADKSSPMEEHERHTQLMKLANAGRDEAAYAVGMAYLTGSSFIQQNKAEALKWFLQAETLGNACAPRCLGQLYLLGDAVKPDTNKALRHMQKAAELGDPSSFFGLGMLYKSIGNINESALSYRKAVICGFGEGMVVDALRSTYQAGFITKDEYASTLREGQAAINEMKSQSRDKAKILFQEVRDTDATGIMSPLLLKMMALLDMMAERQRQRSLKNVKAPEIKQFIDMKE